MCIVEGGRKKAKKERAKIIIFFHNMLLLSLEGKKSVISLCRRWKMKTYTWLQLSQRRETGEIYLLLSIFGYWFKAFHQNNSLMIFIYSLFFLSTILDFIFHQTFSSEFSVCEFSVKRNLLWMPNNFEKILIFLMNFSWCK